jgi:uncharacterized membrane protein (UPF0127 family)
VNKRPQPLSSTSGRALAFSFLLLLAACTSEPRLVLHPEGRDPVTVRVEVADTPESRRLGLMYRTHLDEDQGMIFFFERDADHGFWMKNTPLSLDMIFISAEGRIVGIAADTRPFSLESVRGGAPARAVLEVRSGFARRHGLKPGDRVAYEAIVSPLLPR